MRLVGPTIIRECSFLSNSASVRGLAVVAVRAANISYSYFEGNELYCAAGSYQKDTNTEEVIWDVDSILLVSIYCTPLIIPSSNPAEPQHRSLYDCQQPNILRINICR